jgi:aspartate racemase
MPAARTLGVIGGMGPLATADFLQKLVRLTDACTDQEHVPVLLYSDPRIPDRTQAILRGEEEQVLVWLTVAAFTLERAGAEALAIPCNTAHHWLERLRQRTTLDCIAMPDAVVSRLKALPDQRGPVALLATRGTWKTGVYASALKRAGIDLMPADPRTQDDVDLIIADVKAGRSASAERRMKQICREFADAGVETLILGCTELPIAAARLLAARKTPLRLIDTNAELARRCAQWSRG